MQELIFVLALVLVIFLVLMGIFVAIPAWALVMIGQDKALSGAKRMAWLAAILLVWPIASYLYMLLFPLKKWQKVVGILGLALSILGYASMPVLIEKSRESNLTVLNAYQEVPPNFTTETSSEQRDEFLQSLAIFKKEVETAKWYDVQVSADQFQLMEMLTRYDSDQVFNAEELRSWLEKFHGRKPLR